VHTVHTHRKRLGLKLGTRGLELMTRAVAQRAAFFAPEGGRSSRLVSMPVSTTETEGHQASHGSASGTSTFSVDFAGRLVGTTNSLQGGITNNAAVEFAQTANGTYAGARSGRSTPTARRRLASTTSRATSSRAGS
jgi:hypothetical protein